ncbi:MAG: hypothetical protein ABI216_19580 [Devosia sp.]
MPADQKPIKIVDGSEIVERMEGLDPDDPHPAEEGDPYNTQHPSGVTKGPDPDIGPNPSKHDGTAPSRPHNVENDPKR